MSRKFPIAVVETANSFEDENLGTEIVGISICDLVGLTDKKAIELGIDSLLGNVGTDTSDSEGDECDD